MCVYCAKKKLFLYKFRWKYMRIFYTVNCSVHAIGYVVYTYTPSTHTLTHTFLYSNIFCQAFTLVFFK